MDVNDIFIGKEHDKAEKKKQILIVDDQEFNIKAIEIIFKYKLKINFENICVSALSGQKALELVQKKVNQDKESFKLILMDYEMPELNGPQTTDLIRTFLYNANID